MLLITRLGAQGTIMQSLDVLLDKTKLAVFKDSNSAFLSVLLCNLEFSWNTEISTARTNGKFLQISPDFFNKISQDTREFVLLHELWHVARAHPLRGLNKSNHSAWQYACDVIINNDLSRSGYTFKDVQPLIDLSLPEGMSEEELYDKVKDSMEDIPEEFFDVEPLSSEDSKQLLETIIQAKEIAKGKLQGLMASQLDGIITGLLPPKIQWKDVLNDFVSLSEDTESSFKKRNRRFPEICLPSQIKLENLGDINYYLDVSGSVSDEDVRRFNSELHYLIKLYDLPSINIIQFDTQIVKEETVEDVLTSYVARGGGTSLECVQEHIEKTTPEFVIIFSDLECDPMSPLNYNPKLLWVIINNSTVIPPFGKYVHITT